MKCMQDFSSVQEEQKNNNPQSETACLSHDLLQQKKMWGLTTGPAWGPERSVVGCNLKRKWKAKLLLILLLKSKYTKGDRENAEGEQKEQETDPRRLLLGMAAGHRAGSHNCL